MPSPNNAQRRDLWFSNNHEGRYGAHRPSARLVGASWRSCCGCADTACTRGEDDYDHPTFEDAMEASRLNLRLAEHGPAA